MRIQIKSLPRPSLQSSSLLLKPPIPPMEALSQPELPIGEQWAYEPKWDGFRCLAFKNGDDVYLQSKSGQPLSRYFPEVKAALAEISAPRFVLDGELVIAHGQKSSFDDLLQRIHPAASRIKKLSEETPATYILFDLLQDDHGNKLMNESLSDRRAALEALIKKYFKRHPLFKLSPQTTDEKEARAWFQKLRDALDGVVAKNLHAHYEPGLRTGVMQKIKNMRTAECVVGGFRYETGGRNIGSLLLGLYDEAGKLNHVGFTASFDEPMKRKLKAIVEPLIEAPGFTGNAPGGPSRWSTKRTSEWKPLKPKLVVEVQYDHFTGDRFRHGTRFLRWRPDKAPRQCRDTQVRHESASPLALL